MYGDKFSAINEYQLKGEGKEIFKTIRKVFEGSLVKSRQIKLRSKEFDILLDAVMPSFKNDCQDVIPYYGNSIVRMK